MPEPMRTSTRPSTSSAISASRTDGRDTPSCFARSRSGGSRAPGGNSPERISAADLVGDLPVEPAGFDALERHGSGAAGSARAACARRSRTGHDQARRLIPARQLVKWYYQFRPRACAAVQSRRRTMRRVAAVRARAPVRDAAPHARHDDRRDPRHPGHGAARGAAPAQQRRALGPLRAHDRRGRDRRRLRRAWARWAAAARTRARLRRARRLPARATTSSGSRRCASRSATRRRASTTTARSSTRRSSSPASTSSARSSACRCTRCSAASCATRSSSRATSSSATTTRRPGAAKCARPSSWSRTRAR